MAFFLYFLTKKEKPRELTLSICRLQPIHYYRDGVYEGISPIATHLALLLAHSIKFPSTILIGGRRDWHLKGPNMQTPAAAAVAVKTRCGDMRAAAQLNFTIQLIAIGPA